MKRSALTILTLVLGFSLASGRIVVHTSQFIDDAAVTDSCSFTSMPGTCGYGGNTHYSELGLNVENVLLEENEISGLYSQQGACGYPMGGRQFCACPVQSYIRITPSSRFRVHCNRFLPIASLVRRGSHHVRSLEFRCLACVGEHPNGRGDLLPRV